MENDQKEALATKLAEGALKDYKLDNQADAIRSLKHAMSISSQNPVVLKVLQEIQQDQNTSGLVRYCRNFILQKNEQAANEAIRLLKDPAFTEVGLTKPVVLECLDLLLLGDKGSDTLVLERSGSIVAGILRYSGDGRKFVAEKLDKFASAGDDSGRNSLTAMLERFWSLGEDAVDGTVGVLVDPAAWKSKEQRQPCIRFSFKFYLEKLKSGESATQAIAMKAIARILASDSEDVHHIVDRASLNWWIVFLHPRCTPELRSHATLAMAKYIEASGEVGQSLLSLSVLSKIKEDTEEDLILAFSVGTAIFPLIPGIAAQLLTMEGFLEEILASLQGRSAEVERAALKMLSAASGDQKCRAIIKQRCSEYLEAILRQSTEDGHPSKDDMEPSLQTLAALITAKLRFGTGEGSSQEVERLADIFEAMMIKGGESTQKESIEGLAYSSLQPSVKDSLIKNQNFIQGLLSILKKADDQSLLYGALTIVLNFTRYPPALTEEQKKLQQLKSYANAKPVKKIEVDPFEKDEAVTARCKVMLDAGLIPILAPLGKKLSPSATILVTSIIFSISKNQKHRGLIAQQGGAKYLLQAYSSADIKIGSEGNTVEQRKIKQLGAHALARILVSVDPSRVFSSQLPVSSAVRPLAMLLGQDDSGGQQDGINVTAGGILGTFEALLALTNLASVDDSTRELIIRTGHSEFENTLLSDNPMIQRATTELICNLMACPTMIKYFSDGSGASKQRLHILLALADAEDIATRRAAGGALAMLTEEPVACEAICRREGGINIILQMLEDESNEIVHRGVVCLSNMINGLKKEYIEEIKKAGAVEILGQSMKRNMGFEILGIGIPTLKQLMA